LQQILRGNFKTKQRKDTMAEAKPEQKTQKKEVQPYAVGLQVWLEYGAGVWQQPGTITQVKMPEEKSKDDNTEKDPPSYTVRKADGKEVQGAEHAKLKAMVLGDRVNCTDKAGGTFIGALASMTPMMVKPDGWNDAHEWDEVEKVFELKKEEAKREDAKPMDVDAAKKQVKQMEACIEAETAKKVRTIQAKGMEEFNAEKNKIVTKEKEKIREQFANQRKVEETKQAINKSLATNQSRLEKIKKRQEVLSKLSEEAREKLKAKAADKNFVTKLIVQGALMLLEESVVVQCRKSDEQLVQSCLGDAQAEYTKVIQSETKATKKLTLSIDKQNYLAPAPGSDPKVKSCLGGVVLSCQNGTIVIDNTVDLRLQLVLEQDKPAIRKTLFPTRAR